MIPSKIKIESFAKRCHMGTLGGKGLRILLVVVSLELRYFIFDNCFFRVFVCALKKQL